MSENEASTSQKNEGSEVPFKRRRQVSSVRNLSLIDYHTQQMAKALFDNTVNTMIEEMGFPLPDFETLVDNEGNIEDEAVRMAIQSHGLQKPCSCVQKRQAPRLPESIPFHQRNYFNDPPSTSYKPPLEADFLSEAVSIAIQKKGLGASHSAL